MEYAVVRIGGKQYKISKGDVLEVDRQSAEKDGPMELNDVLLLASDGKIKIGEPKVANVTISAKILEHNKGEKIRVAKFKSKVRYRKVVGFRPMLTKLQIVDIKSQGRNSNGKLEKGSGRKSSKSSNKEHAKRS